MTETLKVHMENAATIKRWHADGEAVIFDVREPDEWAAEHIPGAILNPLSAFDPEKITAPAGKKIVLHCRSGRRCGLASEILAQTGWKGEVHRMTGGMIAWNEIGGPVEK